MKSIPFLSTAFLHSTTKTFCKSSTLLNTSSRTLAMSTESTLSNTSIFGGDFAGQFATFSPRDGKVIQVPEHLVPSAMVEWGQVPTCLECIVSEDLIMKEADNTKQQVLERCTVTVLPETGCGIDNLETKSATKRIYMKDLNVFDINKVEASQVAIVFDEKEKTFEIIFSLNGMSSSDSEIQRCRVLLRLDDDLKLSDKRPIEVVRESRTSLQSSQGSTGKSGGGLYSSRVMELVGRDHINRPFSDESALEMSFVAGLWCFTNIGTTKMEWNGDDVVLTIPGGIGSLALEIPDLKSDGTLHTKIILNLFLKHKPESSIKRRFVAECSVLKDRSISTCAYEMIRCIEPNV